MCGLVEVWFCSFERHNTQYNGITFFHGDKIANVTLQKAEISGGTEKTRAVWLKVGTGRKGSYDALCKVHNVLSLLSWWVLR